MAYILLARTREDLPWYRIPIAVLLVVNCVDSLGSLLRLYRSLRSDLFLFKDLTQDLGRGVAQLRVRTARRRCEVQGASRPLSRPILSYKVGSASRIVAIASSHNAASCQVLHQSVSEHHYWGSLSFSPYWMVVRPRRVVDAKCIRGLLTIPGDWRCELDPE